MDDINMIDSKNEVKVVVKPTRKTRVYMPLIM